MTPLWHAHLVRKCEEMIPHQNRETYERDVLSIKLVSTHSRRRQDVRVHTFVWSLLTGRKMKVMISPVLATIPNKTLTSPICRPRQMAKLEPYFECGEIVGVER